MELTTQDLISSTRDLLNAVRTSSIHIGKNLYEIKQNLPPEIVWAELIRDEFDLSEGQCSKLMSVYKTYVLEGGLEPDMLEGVDTERLYLAKNLEGSVEEKYAKAKSLTRRELKEEKADDTDHQHEPITITICKSCSIRLHDAPKETTAA